MDDTRPAGPLGSTPPEPGARIGGRYRLMRRIGSGGMGVVHEAFDEHLERRVAIKLMSFAGRGEVSVEEIFAKTSRILAQLSHPGIVPLHDSGEDQGTLYLVMDLVDGTSVSDVLLRARQALGAGSNGRVVVPRDGQALSAAIGRPAAKGRRNLIGARSWFRAVAEIVSELAGTLEAAHDAGVVHRDLKPGNVMLLGGGEPVVLDFDLAGRLDAVEGAVTQSLTGTVAYLAPEQVKSYRIGADPRSDVYQLGLILYELLTLRRAFPGTVATEVLARISCGVFPLPRRLNPGLSRDLEAICLKAIELDPEKRYQSARELREDLRCYLDGRAVPTAVRSSQVRKLARTSRYLARRYPAVAAALLALFATVVTFAVIEWNKRENEPLAGEEFRVSKQDGLQFLRLDDRVLHGDKLGIEIEAGAPSYVYGFSVFGGDRPEDRLVNPCPPQLHDGSQAAAREGHWALLLPKGRHKVIISELVAGTSAAAGEWEGVVAFASTAPESWLEAACAEIDLRKGTAAGLPYKDAFEILVRSLEDPPLPPTMRGGPTTSDTVDRIKRLQGLLKREHLEGRQPWPDGLKELQRKAFERRVAGP